MARGTPASQGRAAKSEYSQGLRARAKALLDEAQNIEAREMAEKYAAREARESLNEGQKAFAEKARTLFPASALQHSAEIALKPAPEGLKSFEIERWNRNNKDAQDRFLQMDEIYKESKSDKEFFDKLGERTKRTDSGNYVIQTGYLYNGNLDGKQRAEQFLDSVKKGFNSGFFGGDYKDAKVTFKGSRKDEIRIDFPEGTSLEKRSQLRSTIRNLGRAMTQTQTEYYGDGFGYTRMPTVKFRVGGKEVDSIDYI